MDSCDSSFFFQHVSITTATTDSAWELDANVLMLFMGDSLMTLKEKGSQSFTGNQDMVSGWIVFAVLLSALTLGNTI